VSARLEHEPASDPVEFAQEMLAFFAHVGAVQQGASARYEAYWVAAGVGVDTEKGF
jgi:hypothetical protein